ncbi:MAG: hypothetical protein N3I35_18670 [Clostridia bacterium]|nr:hypothetical protein [Clostridia bacterium]
MEGLEAVRILKRLESLWIKCPFEERPGQKEEYAQFLLKYDYKTMDKAIDISATQAKFFPTLAELTEAYISAQEQIRSNRESQSEQQMCYVCMNKGFISHKINVYEMADGRKAPLEYILYCTECEKGETFKYDGRNCKDHKTNYITEPVNKYFDIESLKAKNIFDYNNKPHEPVPMPVYVKQALREATRKMWVAS